MTTPLLPPSRPKCEYSKYFRGGKEKGGGGSELTEKGAWRKMTRYLRSKIFALPARRPDFLLAVILCQFGGGGGASCKEGRPVKGSGLKGALTAITVAAPTGRCGRPSVGEGLANHPMFFKLHPR